MEDDSDLKDFDNVCRLFPLPGVVMFPHSVLPLHIFEPRYRQMTEDALATDRLIAIVQVRSTSDLTLSDEPELETYGCLGRIFKHERLPDGRFKFLLLGRKRIRLERELVNGKMYRSSEVSIVEDLDDDESNEIHRQELISLFRRNQKGTVDRELDTLFESDIPLGVLTDIMVQAIGLSASIKQSFLAQPSVSIRVQSLLERLRGLGSENSEMGTIRGLFPPPFSVN